jgi:hypothetical protein
MLDSLLEVIKQDLKPTFEVHSGLLDKTLRTIAFLDLWHIFQPGQIVMSENHGREQLYMVYSTGSNIPIISFQDRQRDSNVTGPSRARRWDVVSPMVDSDEEEAWNFAKDTQSQEDVEYPPFILHVYYMVYDGTLVGPACRTLRIPYYSGEKSVLDLPAYPVSLHPSAQSITDRFLDRGQRFITNYGHKHYEGMTVSADQHEKSFLIDELQGEVYLDIKTGYRFLGKKYMPKMSKPTLDATKDAEARDWESHRRIDRNDFVEHEQNKSVDRKRTNEFLNGNAANYRILSSEKASKIKEYLLLLPHQVPAFVFRLRSWSKTNICLEEPILNANDLNSAEFLDIDSVRDIDKSDAAAKSGFNDLVIPDAYRRLLISVIESHKSGKGSSGNSKAPKMSTQMDIVRGKGRGLIILLHGPPGVGKTSTAETIAAYSRRPLYPLTSGDIGFTPTEIENNLNYHFSLASQWGCIMLIDEADVFLMKRDWGDIQRNALVSGSSSMPNLPTCC